MTGIRRLAWVALVLSFGHIVFGAIVRISGSGMGCGDHWPKCQGFWFPPLARIDLIIEVSHRYFAATLSATILALLLLTWSRRHRPGVAGVNGALRPVMLSAALVIAAALFGAVVVKLELQNKFVIVTHLSIAMAMVGALLVAVVRAGGPPRIPEYARTADPSSSFDRTPGRSLPAWVASDKTARGALAAAALAYSALVFGALTAHIPGANTACQGFPLCRGGLLPAHPDQYIQFVHRLIAFALLFHLAALAWATSRRGERRMSSFARGALAVCLLQVVVAAVMVELRLPQVWRSLHEAAGTLLWIVIFLFALVARRVALGPAGAAVRAVAPRVPALGAEANA